jgi:hypothetical protein
MFFVSSIQAAYSVHCNLHDFTILTISGDLYESLSSLLCNIQNIPVTSCLLGLDIFFYSFFQTFVIHVPSSENKTQIMSFIRCIAWEHPSLVTDAMYMIKNPLSMQAHCH